MVNLLCVHVACDPSQMDALRAKVAAFIEGRDLSDGDIGDESQVGERESLLEDPRHGGLAAAAEDEATEEGTPPPMPMSAALPHGHGGRTVGDLGAGALKLMPVGVGSAGNTLSAPMLQFGLSPVSTTSIGGGAPPESPMPSGTMSTGYSRTSTASSKPGTIHAL